MSDLPIQSLTVSDFRRIEGTHQYPFDAPVVLLHGPNGSGKTSILSALELALTGRIRSMERQSDHYRAHLPHLGQAYATVRAGVADYLRGTSSGSPMTVGGARLEGSPAFADVFAKFFAERCFLDQASLGRLLELYQAREGSEKSALELFVNELLGLEKLDALRSGLSDAIDLRLLKKLAVGVDEADREAKAAAIALKEESAARNEIQTELSNARAALIECLTGLGRVAGPTTATDVLLQLVEELGTETTSEDLAYASGLHQELVALSGRVSAATARSAPLSLEQARAVLEQARASKTSWERVDGVRVRDWETSARAIQVDLTDGARSAVERATRATVSQQEKSEQARTQIGLLEARLGEESDGLKTLQARLADAHEQSSALVETLAAARGSLGEGNVCPVCDRDYTETGHNLLSHIDSKLAEMTIHGQELVSLRLERYRLSARVSRTQLELAEVQADLLSVEQADALSKRRDALDSLTDKIDDVEAARARGLEIEQQVGEAQRMVDSLEAASVEEMFVAGELARYATLLDVAISPTFDSFEASSLELLRRAKSEVDLLNAKLKREEAATQEALRLRIALDRESSTTKGLADVAVRKKEWDDRIAEAKRRQGVAKDVYDAATNARTNIIHRVFTEALNEVWKSVFTRLAPAEGFVPSFGVPSATRKSFDIKLETIHRDGETSGPPQMMLSAGNLNTAALSLFLALHLAVEPIVPCLVFDDPVQAMDEVHVSQFAALIRVLAKQNNRQVVIAVHERELFEYLALELSPAFQGDELITIELGERAADEDKGITRHVWADDPAIAN